MRNALALIMALLIPSLICLGGCSGEDKKAARQQKIKDLKEQLRQVYTQIDDFQNSPEYKDATTASYKAQAALIGAKKRGDEAAIEEAQATYDEAAAVAKDVFAKKDMLDKEKNRLRDKIIDLGGTP